MISDAPTLSNSDPDDPVPRVRPASRLPVIEQNSDPDDPVPGARPAAKRTTDGVQNSDPDDPVPHQRRHKAPKPPKKAPRQHRRSNKAAKRRAQR